SGTPARAGDRHGTPMTGHVRTEALPQPARQPERGIRPALPTIEAPVASGAPLLCLIAAGAMAVVALWWSDTPSVHGLGAWLTGAGRITGLLAGYAVVVLLALMARIPALEHGLGADRLARWHAQGGRYTVSLVAAHALLITWGYAVTAHTSPVAQASTLLTSYPDVLMATVAGGLLVLVGVTSARAARRRLRYETWYLLHLYTYLAVALAFSHQFADGAEFSSNLPARVAWSALYVGVAALLVWYRVVTPVRRALRHRLRVVAVRSEAPGVVSVVVAGRHLDELGARPGQFFRWRILGRGLWWASNPYSLSAPVRADRMRFTAKALGDHSAALRSVRPGTWVFAEGPYGAFTDLRRTRRKVLLIAGGVGITPIRSLFEGLPAGRGDVTLIYRASSRSDVVFGDELSTIAERRGATLRYLLGRRTDLGHDPLSAAALMQLVPGLRHHEAYVCGPPPMVAAAVAGLRGAGVSRRHIHRESFEL
ncbi:MAG: ferredoxin reductase family protein, partial [Mycobacteriales bacterium]